MTEYEFSKATLSKAQAAVKAGLVEQDPEQPSVWWVESINNSNRYRVQSDFDPATGVMTWVTCTCPHGLNTGAGRATCYHVAAAMMRILARREIGKESTPK